MSGLKHFAKKKKLFQRNLLLLLTPLVDPIPFFKKTTYTFNLLERQSYRE